MKHVTKKIFIVATIVVFAVIIVWEIFMWNFMNDIDKIFSKYKYTEIASEFFTLRYYEKDNYYEITGTTEQGNNQRFLVISEYIDGIKVHALGYNAPFRLYEPDIKSDVIEKVYFEDEIEEINSYSFRDCPNVEKVMYPAADSTAASIGGYGITVYCPRKMYEAEYGTKYISYGKCLRANVSYYYNYEGAEHDGYYWIDDCDYGSMIEYIPPAPKREGYTFAGWYKESECTNAWDFDTDTLPEEKKGVEEVYKNGDYVLEEIVVYQETILYAKWV